MSELEIVFRLAMSLVFGMIVGIERQWHHKNAGIKTNTLVSVGATALALISLRGFGPTNNPAAIAAGVVTGIGFIGAGVIMRRAGSIQGINSAATLWAAGSLGLAIGAGYFVLAPLLLVAILIIQVPLKWVAAFVDRRSKLINPHLDYRLTVRFAGSSVDAVRSAWRELSTEKGVLVTGYAEALSVDGECTLEASFQLADELVPQSTQLAQRIAALDGVKSASVSRAHV